VIRGRLLAGEALIAAQVAEELGVSRTRLRGVVLAMEEAGHRFERTKAGRGAVRYQLLAAAGPRSNGNGRALAARPKMPAPQVDAPTEVVLIHRVSDDEVDVAIRQGGRQWLMRVTSCVE
jgi:biotin operon repressor